MLYRVPILHTYQNILDTALHSLNASSSLPTLMFVVSVCRENFRAILSHRLCSIMNIWVSFQWQAQITETCYCGRLEIKSWQNIVTQKELKKKNFLVVRWPPSMMVQIGGVDVVTSLEGFIHDGVASCFKFGLRPDLGGGRPTYESHGFQPYLFKGECWSI
ncbi:hypothetical protein XENTR_v10014106 [Xenopus tropicalis]|nr:hypothetical protein XENTR_v10014106 [Xenopus tropicalis]